MQLSPYRHLLKKVIDLELYLGYKTNRWFAGARDDFSWVYGLSEIEIKEFATLYSNTKLEIKYSIEIEQIILLKNKLEFEFNLFPQLDQHTYILNIDGILWFTRPLVPFKKISRTIKFKDILEDIRLCCETMISNIQNVEWLELEKNKNKSG